MSPTSNNGAMRVLVSALLASSFANAVALPHQVLDTRAPAPMQNAELAAEAFQAAASAAAKNPSNFFEDVSDQLNHRTAWEVFRDFFIRLFGPRDDDGDDTDDDDSDTSTTTVYVTPTAIATLSLDIVLPPGPSGTPTEVVSVIPSVTPVPESEIIFSILPIGDLTTSINATALTPIFVTAPESDMPIATPSVIEIVAPFPILNVTSGVGILPTAASISGSFSVMIPLVTDMPTLSNYTAPVGTGIALPLPGNSTNSPTNVTVIVVTETVTPVPVLGTGTAISVSAGTGLPIVIDASPIWPNSTYNGPTAVILPIGTAMPIGTGTAIIIESAALPLGTGIPLVTGTGSLPTETILPIESPLFPNTTTTTIAIIPILGTGVFSEPVNATAILPTNMTSVDAVAPLETQVPLTVTGVPGAVLNISFTIPTGPYANTTTIGEATAVGLPVQTVPPPVSVGTGLPVPSIVEVSAPFANTTTATETATAILILPGPPVATDVDAGQLNVTVSLSGNYAG